MEQIVLDAEDRALDTAWERQLGDLATEHLLAIRDQVQVLVEQVTAECEAEHIRVGGLLAAAGGLLQRLQQSGLLVELPGEAAELYRSAPDAKPGDAGAGRR